MKLAVVVQRYGADINGGAELHARQIAEHLARHDDVTVLTTCARDYITWRNELPAGRTDVNGVNVERFPVVRERDPAQFGRLSELVFSRPHSVDDELRWLESEGPLSPELMSQLEERGGEFDYALFFSVRYYHAYHGTRVVPSRAVLVPTAEREPSLGVSLFAPVFRDVRAIMYNSPEERELIRSLSHNDQTPGVVVGVGVEMERRPDPARFRAKFGIDTPYVIYIGRIDENKGCPELFDYFRSYVGTTGDAPLLLLVGTAVIEIPRHPHIRHLGFVDDEDKFDALAGAETLIMPSYYESLSMVVLEAWSLARPVLANARCDVLMGQCVRSNAGLYYRSGEEFCGALGALLHQPGLADALGCNGRMYCERHYAWPIVERKYQDMFARLDADHEGRRQRQPEPLPGWWTRGRRQLAPAASRVHAAPSGPVRDSAELAL